tara:strand:- start:275 stop:511 length:237 start_codon:yes stop_codon:yes gene_type:complete
MIMKNIIPLLIGFLSASCFFVLMGVTVKGMEEFSGNGRYLPLKINENEKVVMMDSKTGDLYFPSPDGWKLDMTKINKK